MQRLLVAAVVGMGVLIAAGVTGTSDSQILVNWSAATGATGYSLYEYMNGASNFGRHLWCQHDFGAGKPTECKYHLRF